jgi:hypothetical protein
MTRFALFLIGLGIALIIILVNGCGGSPSASPDLIVNRTSAADSVLQAAWSQAQQTIATGNACLNYECRSFLPPDSKALSVSPRGAVVECRADVPVSELARKTGDPRWLNHTDPSNTIWLDGSDFPTPVHGWTDGSDPGKVVVACSGVAIDTPYEFENIILKRLGYNTDYR